MISKHLNFVLQLIASDANGSNYSRKTGTPLVIHIVDVNDESPKFSRDMYTFNVTENQSHSTNIGNVSVTDADSGVYFFYNIVSGDDGKFVIDSRNGIYFYLDLVSKKYNKYLLTMLILFLIVLNCNESNLFQKRVLWCRFDPREMF